MENIDVIALDVPREGIPPVITGGDILRATELLAQGTGPFALDTERAMGYRYYPRAWLIQIRREGAGTFLIDPVGSEDRLAPLAQLLTTEEWILHDAHQDLPCLAGLGLVPRRLFDTAMAGLLLGFERVSLQAEIAEVLGYALAKEHSADDWSIRPLSEQMRAYAALDVELLVPLRDALADMLHTSGRYEWMTQECEAIRLAPPKQPKPGKWRKAARRAGLSKRISLGIFRALWDLRESYGRRMDLLPESIIPSADLGSIAAALPRSRTALAHHHVMCKPRMRRYLDDFWGVIEPVWHLPQAELPSFHGDKHTAPNRQYVPDHRSSPVYPLIHQAVIGRAEHLGILQEVLLRPKVQKELVHCVPNDLRDLPSVLLSLGARPWQVEEVSPALIAALASQDRESAPQSPSQ